MQLQTIQIVKSQKGFSLIELMIASSISTIVGLAIAGIYIFAINQFSILINMNKAQESLLWTAYQVRILVSQAVDVGVADASGFPLPGTGSGVIQNYPVTASRRFSQTIAAFYRENGIDQSSLQATGIIFWEPSPTESGIVFFDTYPANGVVNVSAGNMFMNRIVKFTSTTERQNYPDGTQGVISANFVIATRYFRKTNRDGWLWCSAYSITSGAAGCNPAALADPAAYSDTEMEVKVPLRNNNAIPQNQTDPSMSIHGGIYYLKPVMPPTLYY